MANLTGTIVVSTESGTPTVTAARVAVKVRDVTDADVESQIVASSDLVEDISPGRRIDFSVDVSGVDRTRNRDYNLDVHVDLDRSGHLSVGDLITMRHYPVLADDGQGGDDEAVGDVDVRLIR